MPPRRSRSISIQPAKTSIASYVKIGFGFGIGSLLAGMIFIALAMILFIPGFIIVSKQHKLPKEKRSTAWLVFGYILMGLGMILGLGFGASAFFGALGEDI